MSDQVSRKAYLQTLPRKRVSAGCLFFDEVGRLLLVKPTYKDAWDIPGGVIEAGESPLAGCIREIHEELGLHWSPRRLLGINYTAESPQRTESLHFIFYGGVLPAEAIAAIRLPAKELSEYAFLEEAEALSRLNQRLRRRVAACLSLISTGVTAYLEENELVWPAADSAA